MYDLIYYETSSGRFPIQNYIENVARNNPKELSKVQHYLNMLGKYGPEIGQKFHPKSIRKLNTDIWELRIDKHRVLFFFFNTQSIVILHGFRKTTRKIPQKELERAVQERKDYLSNTRTI